MATETTPGLGDRRRVERLNISRSPGKRPGRPKGMPGRVQTRTATNYLARSLGVRLCLQQG